MGKHTFRRGTRSTTSVVLPMVGGVTFLIGSCFFWPGQAEWAGYLGAGAFLFGSLLYLLAPARDYWEMTSAAAELSEPKEGFGTVPHVSYCHPNLRSERTLPWRSSGLHTVTPLRIVCGKRVLTIHRFAKYRVHAVCKRVVFEMSGRMIADPALWQLEWLNTTQVMRTQRMNSIIYATGGYAQLVTMGRALGGGGVFGMPIWGRGCMSMVKVG